MKEKIPRFKLSKEDLRLFSLQNQYATMMFFSATEDYIASRCLLLNGFLRGLGLANEAIEKMLKAFLFLENKKKPKNIHKPLELKQELKRIKDYKLDKFDNLLTRLHGHYQNRYYDNKDASKHRGTDELYEIDTLWMSLVKKMPMPDEMKYRMSFFAYLFEDGPRDYLKTDYWIEEENKALKKEKKKMEAMYKAVEKHIYPQKNT